MQTNKILTYSIIILLIAVLGTPMIVSTSLLFPYIVGKALFFRVVVEIAFALYLILLVRDSSYAPKRSWLLAITSIFLVTTLVSDLFGVAPLKSIWSNFERMEGYFMILHLWMFFVILIGVFKEQKYWKWFWNSSLFFSTIVALYGFCQLFGWVQVAQSGARIDAQLGNAEYLAVYALIHIGIALYMFVKCKTKNGSISALKWVYAALALLQFIVLYNTATRGAIIGLAVGILVSLIFFFFKEKGETREGKLERKIVGSVLVAFIILAGLFVSLRNTSVMMSVRSHSQTIDRLASISISELKTQGRRYIWPMAVEGFKERPILGWGQENFNYIFNEHYAPAMWNQEQWFDRAHNVYLDWLVAGGIIGFLLYASLYVFALLYIWKGSFSVKEKAVLLGLLVAYSINNFFVFDNISSYILFFALLAYLHARRAEKEITQFAILEKINVDIRDLVIAPLIVLVALFAIYEVNWKMYKTGSTLIQALTPQGDPLKNLQYFTDAVSNGYGGRQEVREQLSTVVEQIIPSDKVADDVKLKFYNFYTQQVDLQIKDTPNDTRAYFLPGATLDKVGDYSHANAYLIKALALTPNKQAILLEIGVNNLSQKKYPEALTYLKQAYDLAPENTDAEAYYISGLLFSGDTKTAAQMFAQYPNLENDVRLLGTYIQLKDYAHAVTIYKQQIAADPSDLQSWIGLAVAYFITGQKQLSIQTLQEASVQVPSFKAQADEVIAQIKAGKNPLAQ